MIRVLRRARGRLAVVVLTLSALLAVSVSVLAHDGADDAACALAYAAPGGGPAKISAGQITVQQADHCVLCHASQTVRALLALPGYLPPGESRPLALADPTRSVASIAGTSGPARAPPRA